MDLFTYYVKVHRILQLLFLNIVFPCNLVFSYKTLLTNIIHIAFLTMYFYTYISYQSTSDLNKYTLYI